VSVINGPSTTPSGTLARVVGVPGAVLMGLGSILGTGIFVSIGITAGVAGPGVVLAVILAAIVATFNGLSSAQLAAAHPVSGGTYAYGYRYLNPRLGFTAGWMFLWAKSASAATAALGFSGYVLSAAGVHGTLPRVAVALGLLAVLTTVVAGGIRRSNAANAVIVSVTLVGLSAFVLIGFPGMSERGLAPFQPLLDPMTGGMRGLLHGTALMFVAYTGYGRIATLGEEIREPSRNIPRAIITTLVVTMVVYAAVTAVAVSTAGAVGLASATDAETAPLVVVARLLPVPGVSWVVGIAAVTAMAGVLLNLLLGLSRVAFAMGRQGDLPRSVGHVAGPEKSPVRAVLLVATIIAVLSSSGSVVTTWSFSAFTVLVYYALTNLAALRLPEADRRYPRWTALSGLVCCLGLAFFVDTTIWAAGLTLMALGLVWHEVAKRCTPRSGNQSS